MQHKDETMQQKENENAWFQTLQCPRQDKGQFEQLGFRSLLKASADATERLSIEY